MIQLTGYWIPAIRQYSTKTELLGLEDDPEEAFRWIRQKLPDDWYRTKGLWYVYYVNALAECGLDGSGMPSEWFEATMDKIRGGSETRRVKHKFRQSLQTGEGIWLAEAQRLRKLGCTFQYFSKL